jgi:hypothetical protein
MIDPFPLFAFRHLRERAIREALEVASSSELHRLCQDLS